MKKVKPSPTTKFAAPAPEPPTKTGTLVGVRLQDDLLALLDELRRQEPDMPNRPEELRRILLRHAEAKKTRDK